jgi:hypothetical protein
MDVRFWSLWVPACRKTQASVETLRGIADGKSWPSVAASRSWETASDDYIWAPW